jgi:hypothetical protein
LVFATPEEAPGNKVLPALQKKQKNHRNRV